MPSILTRLREHVGLFAAFLITALLVTGLLTGGSALVARHVADGVRAALSERTGAAVALRIGLPLADDPVEQDAQVRAMLARAFGDLEAGIAVDRTVQGVVSLTPETAAGTAGARSVVAMSIPDLPDRADLVAGDWPAAPDQVTLQQGFAADQGLGPGDHVVLGGMRLEVAGTWTLADRFDPAWLGDPLLESGESRPYIGPVVVDESLWVPIHGAPLAQWTLVPDVAEFGVSDVSALPRDWRLMSLSWRGDPAGLDGLVQTGGLLPTLRELQGDIAGLGAVQPLGVLLLAIVAFITFAELARLLTAVQSAETALLWSRGASVLRITLRSAAEIALVAAIGALLGAVAAWLVVGAVAPGDDVGPAASLPWGVATVAGAVGTVAVAIARSASRQTVRDPSAGAGRGRRVAGPGLVVLVSIAAAVSVWQLRLYGTSLTPSSDGGVGVDPVALPAPVLALIAIVLLALLAFPAVARLVERFGRGSGIRHLLATRNVARRPALAAAPLLLVAIAVAGLTTASAYQATWSSAFDTGSRLATGQDLLVTDAAGIDARTIDALRAVDGVDGVAELDRMNLQFGTGNGVLVGTSPSALEVAAARLPSSLALDGIGDALRADLPGPALPSGATVLQVTITTRGLSADPALAVHLRDAGGILHTLPLALAQSNAGEVGTGSEHRSSYTATLPAESSLQLVAVDVVIAPGTAADALDDAVTLSSLRATSAAGTIDVPLGDGWVPESPLPQAAPPTPTVDGLGFGFDSQSIGGRLIAALDDPDPAPVVLSTPLADAYGIGPGDHFTFTLEATGRDLEVVVAAVVPVIPSATSDSAVLIDAGFLQNDDLAKNETPDGPRALWIASGDPDAVAGALHALLPANARVDTATDPGARAVLGSAATSLWLAAVGCAVLGVVGVAASGSALRRERRSDVAVLRALGLSAGDQAAIRRRELGGVILAGAVAGGIAGWATAILTVPLLARAAAPGVIGEVAGGISTPVLVDLLALGVALAALAVSLLVVVAALGWAVAAEARNARREESR